MKKIIIMLTILVAGMVQAQEFNFECGFVVPTGIALSGTSNKSADSSTLPDGVTLIGWEYENILIDAVVYDADVSSLSTTYVNGDGKTRVWFSSGDNIFSYSFTTSLTTLTDGQIETAEPVVLPFSVDGVFSNFEMQWNTGNVMWPVGYSVKKLQIGGKFGLSNVNKDEDSWPIHENFDTYVFQIDSPRCTFSINPLNTDYIDTFTSINQAVFELICTTGGVCTELIFNVSFNQCN